MKFFSKTHVIAVAIFLALTQISAQTRLIFAHGEPSEQPPIRPFAVDQSQTQENPNPTGFDPLTPAEIERARTFSEKSQGVSAAHAQSIARTSRVPTLSNFQFLFAQRFDEKKGAPSGLRRADVVYYNYANDEVVRLIVNLKTGEIDKVLVTRAEGNQPPVTSIEANAAAQLILDHPELGASLRRMFRQASGREPRNASEIDAQGVIYFVNATAAKPLDKITQICRFHRCIQLFIPFDETRQIDASNLVIDLSAGQLLWANKALKLYIDHAEVIDSTNTFLPPVFR
jgi:hypothetical protein